MQNRGRAGKAGAVEALTKVSVCSMDGTNIKALETLGFLLTDGSLFLSLRTLSSHFIFFFNSLSLSLSLIRREQKVGKKGWSH